MILSRVSSRHVLIRPVLSSSRLKLFAINLPSGQRSLSTQTTNLENLFDELVCDPARGLPKDISAKMKDVPLSQKWKWLSDHETLIEQRKNEFSAIVNDPEKVLTEKTKQELLELPVQHQWGIINLEQQRQDKKQEELDNTITINVYEADGTLKTITGDVGKQSLFEAIVEGGIKIPYWTACDASVVTNPEQQLEDWGDGPACTYCSVHVADEFLGKMLPQEWKELDLLWYTEDYRKNTRLSCQIPLTKDLDGMTVAVAEEGWMMDNSTEAMEHGDHGGVDVLDMLWENPEQLNRWNENRRRDAAKAAIKGEEERFRNILNKIKGTAS